MSTNPIHNPHYIIKVTAGQLQLLHTRSISFCSSLIHSAKELEIQIILKQHIKIQFCSCFFVLMVLCITCFPGKIKEIKYWITSRRFKPWMSSLRSFRKRYDKGPNPRFGHKDFITHIKASLIGQEL